MMVMKVIREANNVERKRRQTKRKDKCDEVKKTMQRAKALISDFKGGGVERQEIERRLESIFGKGSREEIAKATTDVKIVERVMKLSRREEQFEVWEKNEKRIKKRQREDRRMNVFWRKNKSFPPQFGCEEGTPDAETTLEFWRRINNKEVGEGWRDDESIQEVLQEMRETLQRRRCRWDSFTEEEFEEVLPCTAPWKACGEDSVNSFPIEKCPPIRKAVYQLVKKMVEWSVGNEWDEENKRLLEGRTVPIFQGGDRKDPANYRPITCLQTITKMVTLAFHKRMRNWLFESLERSPLD